MYSRERKKKISHTIYFPCYTTTTTIPKWNQNQSEPHHHHHHNKIMIQLPSIIQQFLWNIRNGIQPKQRSTKYNKRTISYTVHVLCIQHTNNTQPIHTYTVYCLRIVFCCLPYAFLSRFNFHLIF